MSSVKHLFRLFYILAVCFRYGLLDIAFNPKNHPVKRWFLHPLAFLDQKTMKRGQRIRLSLEALGPIFVKFGQILSTRRDLVPDDIVSELSKLQDKVTPFSGQKATKLVEQALGNTVDNLFVDFNPTPMAAASIAQVHEAFLPSGQAVVVKVLRPNIKKIIRKDIALLYTIAALIKRFLSFGKQLKPTEVVAEFEKTIYKELDLLREAANASQLKRNFQSSKILHIPEVYWHYCHKKVIVLEKISGIPVTDMQALRDQGYDLKKLAERGVEIFFTQVFRDRFFHADMHAGNIFVARENPQDPQYIAVDFGIVGTLTPEDQHYLAYNMLAFFQRDYRKVAELHVESGWVPSDTRIDEFESAIRTVCEPIFERPLKDISFGHMLLRLFQTARRFSMEVQPQLVLLQKTLLNIEGLGREIYPDLNLWNTAKPFLETWMKEQVGFKAIWKETFEKGPYWLSEAGKIPDQILQHFNRLQQQQQAIIQIDKRLMQIESRWSQAQIQNRRGVIGCVLLLSAFISTQVELYHLTPFQDQIFFSLAGLGFISLVLALR